MSLALALLAGCRRQEEAATLDVTVAFVDAAGDPLGDGCREAVDGVAIAVDGSPVGAAGCDAGSVRVDGLVAGERATVTATAYLASGPVPFEDTRALDPGKNAVRFEVPVAATERVSVEPLFFPSGALVEAVELDLSPTGSPCSDLAWATEGAAVANCERLPVAPPLLEAVVPPGAWTWALRGYARGELCWEAGGELDLDAGGPDAPTALGTAFAVPDFEGRCTPPTATATVAPADVACADTDGRLGLDDLTVEVFAGGAGECVDAPLVRAGAEGVTCEPLACAPDPVAVTLPEGDYTVRVTGTAGGVACAVGEAEVALDRDRTVDVPLAPVDDPACVLPDPEVVADSAAEFSATQGADGWTYGYLAIAGAPSTFAPFDEYRPADLAWAAAGTPWWSGIRATEQHPYLYGQAEVVRRWTSEVTGYVRLAGEHVDRDVTCGDGAQVKFYLDDSLFYDQPTSSTPTPFDLVIFATAGQTFDFAVGYHTNDACDATGLTIVVSTVPGNPYAP